ncbi:MAG: CusA/CzcA family heavy metal efflux RND transporter [Thiovulaceae bacterium]|nr:CusA/CzcA family heavy metal efflux RND transporter [Sulfurimonadaceae bacterium]
MRRLANFFIENFLAVLLFTAISIIVSITIVRDLNIEAFPDPAPPILEIVTTNEGHSAEEIEKQITVPLEIALSGMQGLENINSVSLYGLSDIKCKFSYNSNYKEARQEVLNRLSQAQGDIPTDVNPQITPSAIGEIMRYRVVGNRSMTELRTYQDWVVSRYLKTVPNIDDIGSYGGTIKAYSVVVRPDDLIKYKISLSNVIQALSRSNANVGGRVLEFGDQYYTIRGEGLIKSVGDIENTIVTTINNQPIYIKNIADASISTMPRTGIAGLNNSNDIVMGVVVLRKNAPSVSTMNELHKKIDELNNGILPKDIKVVPFYDRQDLLHTVVDKLKDTASIGMILVFAIILVFLGDLRAAIIVAAIIPMSLLYTLTLMAYQQESANLLSLGAIDFGIIVDIPLIVIENYFRLKHQGHEHISAIQNTASEVGKPIIFSIFIIFLAFIPLFAMKGAESQIFLPMAKTYVYAITFAALLTFSFLLASKYTFLLHSHEKVFSFFVWLKEKYLKTISLVTSRIALIATSVIFVSTVLIFTLLGSEFLPKMDEGNLYIRAIFPYSISLNKSYENSMIIRDILKKFPEVKTVQFQAGRPEDGTDPSGPFNTEYFVKLKDYKEWPRGINKDDLEKEIRTVLIARFPRADIGISQYIEDNLEEAMSGVKGENSVKIFGDDLFVLDKLAKEVENKIKNVKDVSDVGIFKEVGQPNLIIEVDREKAAQYGVNVADLMDVVSSSLDGKSISKIIEQDKRFDLVVRFPSSYRKSIENIKMIPVILDHGGIIPLSKITNIYYDTGASFVYRENFKRFIPIKFSVTSNDLAGTVSQVQAQINTIKMPEGYTTNLSGRFEQMQSAFGRLAIMIPASIFLITLVLFIYFGSIRTTMIIFTAALFSIFGGLSFLALFHESLSVSASVGFISILGVSILNASIFVIHYLKLRFEQAIPMEDAITQTASDKFRAILMTGLTASIGLLPAMLSTGVGSQVQKPLAIVVVGGMLIGTFILLILMPALLKFIKLEKI